MANNQISVKNGQMVVNAGHQLSTNCAPTGCCTFLDCNQLTGYRINNYNASLFSPTGCTTTYPSGQPAWDGTFPHYTGGQTWIDSALGFSFSFGGQLLEQATVSFGKGGLGGLCWALTLNLPYTFTAWVGTKQGDSPVGVYTRTSGCGGGPSTLTIEALPGATPLVIPTCYKISGYVDGDFNLTTCPNKASSGAGAWDGSFPAYAPQGGYCDWMIQNADPTSYSISGKQLSGVDYSHIAFNASTCQWNLLLGTYSGGAESDIWFGYKSTGNTPAGVYTRTGGCDPTTSLTIVAC